MADTAQAYRVVGKHILRTETVDLVMGKKADGSDYVVRQPGPITRVEPGTILTDVTDEELAAFPDRFAVVEGDVEALTAAEEEHQIAVARDTKAQGDPIPLDMEAKVRVQDAKDAKDAKAHEARTPSTTSPTTATSEEGSAHAASRSRGRPSDPS
jgi:hypothetical protein